MALRRPLALRHQVDLNVRHVGPSSQKVMADQTVEVVRRSGADVHLIVGHFWHSANVIADLARYRRRAFERRAFGHVNDDLKLALVIKREHLHAHKLQRDE